MKSSNSNHEFYKKKRVLVTGHTGFKGVWLTAMLDYLGATACGYALAPAKGSLFEKMDGATMINHIEGDVRDYNSLENAVTQFQPEVVLHLAAQAIVNDCFNDPRYAYETNVMGTVNLFEAIREVDSVKSVVVVTTDKVYENKGDGAVYVENDPLGGIDPYSASKTCMEYIADSYKQSYLQTESRCVGVSTVRASNVLGGGDHVQSRLIPSILNAIAAGKPVELRNPHQTRPWQSVLDALNGYLTIARMMYEEPKTYSGQWNIGPTIDGIKDVLWIVDKMREHYINAEYIKGEEFDVAESTTLGLSIEKSLESLDWTPLLSCDKMLYNIVEFYKLQQEGVTENIICQKQVQEFFEV
jgi:CDP-glucose 4,6-dehydratase